jgi:hypothetical protein
VLINAPADTLQDMTADQLETYLYGAKLLTDTKIPTDHVDIQQFFYAKIKQS